jgi:hypothetical protein
VWIDRIDDRTGAIIDLDSLRKSPDVVGDVVRTSDELLGDPNAAASLVDAVSASVRRGMPDFEPADGVETLIERARDRVLDLLVDEEVGAE